MFSKKGLSLVISTVLLLLLVLGAYSVYQGWYLGFTNSKLSIIEAQLIAENVDILEVRDSIIYLRSETTQPIQIDIVKVSGVVCIQNITVYKGINTFSLGSCLAGLNRVSEVVLIGKNDVYSKTLPLLNSS